MNVVNFIIANWDFILLVVAAVAAVVFAVFKGNKSVVMKIPCGYKIWNIGKNAPEGYLPLCCLGRQKFEGGREIDPDTLKAIKVDGAEAILAAVGFGPATPSEMVRYVKRYGSSKTPYVKSRVERCRKAIYYMQKIKGIENLSN